MSNPLYKTTEELVAAITKYLKNEPKPTPRHFRAIGLGITKYNLKTWKKTRPEHYHLIKNAEDLILAYMEQKFSYGGKDMYNLKMTMKAYDKMYREESYALEAAEDLSTGKKDVEQKITFVLPKTNAKKGVQSDRKPKLISKR